LNVDTVPSINFEEFYRLLTIHISQRIGKLSITSYYIIFISIFFFQVGVQFIATYVCQRNVQTEKGVITEKIKGYAHRCNMKEAAGTALPMRQVQHLSG